MQLADAVNIYVTGRAARGEVTAYTARQMRWRLGGLIAVCPPGLPLERLDRGHIAAWQASVGQQRPASRRAYLSSVRTFCRWAVVEGLTGVDPTVGVARVREPRRPPRCLSAADLARLELVLPDLRAELVVSLMFRDGLRCVEVARLTGVDYDPASPAITVTGKNGDGRILPVPPETAVLLRRWMAARGERSGALIGITARRLSVLVSRWMADAGIKTGPYDGISAHALRHSFAARTLTRCGNVRTVQMALGHQSLATTQRYLPWATLDELRAAMSA